MDSEPTINVVRELWKYTRPHRPMLCVVVILSFIYTATDLLYPMVYRDVVNDIAGLFVPRTEDRPVEDRSWITELIDGLVEHDGLLNDEQSLVAEWADEFLLEEASSSYANAEEVQLRLAESSSSRGEELSTSEEDLHFQRDLYPREAAQVMFNMITAVLALFLIGMIGYALWMVGENLSERIASAIEQTFLLDTFEHVLHLPISFFNTKSSGVLTKQIDEADHISPIITNLSKHVLPNMVKLFGTFFVMLALNSGLTMIVLITIPLYICLVRYSTKQMQKGFSTYYELWELMSGRLQSAMQSIKTLKLSGAEYREIRALRKLSDKAYTEYLLRARTANHVVFWDAFISHLGSTIVLIIGGYLALKRQLTPGDVVMFVVYVEELYSPIDELSAVWMELQENIASFTRTFRLLKSGVEEKRGRELKVDAGRVDFQDVHYGYTAKRKILKGLSFSARPGQITAIVGSSGAGKTTSMDLLLKLYEVSAGSIHIDGQNIRDLDPASVRANIGLVATDGVLFKMSLRENIVYAADSVDEALILRAVTLAGLSALIDRLPEGLDTEVGEGGVGLSVGERQRVQIARLIIANPRIIILDEATANVDFATEALIRSTIQHFRSTHTIIIIAHRFSMVHDADKVYVMEAGHIVEEGSPAQLIARSGWFAKFAASARDTTLQYEKLIQR